MMKSSIKDICRVVYLLQKANNDYNTLVSEIAKELGEKKTDLMEFILNNPQLFRLDNVKKGCVVKYCYERADLNPYCHDWLERTQKEWEKRLYVAQWDCYGQKENHYLPLDEDSYNARQSKDYRDKKYLWRNTEDKIKEVKKSGHFYEGTGSTGMFTGTTLPYCLNTEHMKALIDEGWTLEGELPSAIASYQASSILEFV